MRYFISLKCERQKVEMRINHTSIFHDTWVSCSSTVVKISACDATIT